jgi:twitching motility two-component system response regulator PilH
MKAKKILVVDDNRVMLRQTSMALVGDGYDVVTAEDGSEAVAKIRTETPDLILLDLLFPPDVGHGGGVAWDGFLILNWLKRLEEAKDVPVVMISITDPATYESRARSAGVRAVLHKPVSKEDLITTIRGVLASQPPKGDEIPSSTKTVLFVDDQGDWRSVVGIYLRSAGFEVLTAKDEAEAVARMQKVKLDVIVLDLNLGGQSGLLLMESLKQQHPGVPIIIYTGLEHDAETVNAMLGQGAREYLRKGTMGELCEAVKRAVN